MKVTTALTVHMRNLIWRLHPGFVLGVFVSFSALADTTTLTISPASIGTSIVPVTLNFPVTRSGDASYEVLLSYRTVNGTATSGVDYTSGSGYIVIPAGSTSANIPVTIDANTSSGPDQTFQLYLGATGTGATQQIFATGSDPLSVAGADINGDGQPDLIVANYGDNTVSVLLSTTAPGAAVPSFAPQQVFATGTNPRSVTIADVNGDGRPDIIVANRASNTVSVLLNTTAVGATIPSFAAQQIFSTGANPFSVATADVNGDGKPDLIVANANDNTVSILLNTTASGAVTSSFAAQQTFATGTSPVSVCVADINGDGKPDLLVANVNDNTVSVLLNNTATGTMISAFGTQQTFAAGTAPESLAVADINGDGKPDVIVSNLHANTVSVLLNTTVSGAITSDFAVRQAFATGANPIAVTAADIDGDGKPDLIVANVDDSTVSTLLNTTAPGATMPSFAMQQPFSTSSPASITSIDLNGDGKLDLIVANAGSNTVSVLLDATARARAATSFATQQVFAAGAFPAAVVATDLNGDGKPDLIVANENSSANTVSVLPNATVPLAFAAHFPTKQTFATGTSPDSVNFADINGDGKPDLIVANSNDNTLSVLLNTSYFGSAPYFAMQQTFATGAAPYSISAADLNGDGKPDLIVANFGAGSVSVLLNTTAPGASTSSFAAQQTFATGSGPISTTTADVNGDGRPDLVVVNFNSQNVSVLINNTPPGSFVPSFAAQQTFATGFSPHSVSAADINGDGKPDLVIADTGALTVSVLINTTVSGAVSPDFAAQQTFATGSAPYSVTTADLNGDGKPDVIAANYNDNTISILFNTTVSGAALPSFAVQQTLATGSHPYSVAAADLNSDGNVDLIVANTGDNTVSVLTNSQYQSLIGGNPATGTIVHDLLFANGFE